MSLTDFKAPHDLHAVCEIIYECYVRNRRAGMCESKSKSRALSRKRLSEIANLIGEPDPSGLVYPAPGVTSASSTH